VKDQSPGRRAAAYWFADGLPDLFLGTILLVFAGAAALWQALAPHPWAYDFWLISGGFLLHLLTERKVLELIKARTTWRRTGYVQPPEELIPRPEFTTLSLDSQPANQNVSHFLRRTVQVVFFILFPLFNSGPPAPWLEPATLAALALALFYANRKTEHPYSGWWAAALAASGLILLGVNVAPRIQALLCYLIAGAWLTAYGLLTQVRYRRANP